MKTFDEALRSVVLHIEEKDATPAVFEAAKIKMRDSLDRVRSLIEEAEASTTLGVVLTETWNKACCENHAISSIFQIGLRIGLEMERQEL